MNRIIRNSLSSIIVLVLSACNLFGPQTTIIGNNPPVRLTVRTQNGATTFSQAGEVITYTYEVTNAGAAPLGGPVLIVDGSKLVTCPEVNTVGNKDNYLDPNETITCTAPYTISQADVTTGSITNVATATVGGVTSAQTGITLTLGAGQPSSVLKLEKKSSSQTYGKAGETITYTYTITNTGATRLGPTQFTVADNKLAGPLNCGDGNIYLEPNQSITCMGTYIITPADANLTNVINSATASGGGLTSAPVSVTITNLAAPITQAPPPAAPPSNLTPGSTISHLVAKGEWLLQISRCYGAALQDVLAANPQITDPDLILPFMTVMVPRIGSVGTIYGPPCVSFYTVQAGDTWESIAQRYNADILVLRKANPVALTAGTMIKIPLNSAGGTAVSVTAIPANTTPNAAPNAGAATPLIRLTIDPGQTSTARVGVINPNETIHYVISATQGQTLSVKLSAPANEVAIGVKDPAGLARKQLDGSPIWSTNVPITGDYFIDIASLTGGSSTSYTLEVTLTTPAATAAPTTPPAP